MDLRGICGVWDGGKFVSRPAESSAGHAVAVPPPSRCHGMGGQPSKSVGISSSRVDDVLHPPNPVSDDAVPLPLPHQPHIVHTRAFAPVGGPSSALSASSVAKRPTRSTAASVSVSNDSRSAANALQYDTAGCAAALSCRVLHV